MNSTPELDRVFPLSAGSSERPALRAPRLTSLVKTTPGVVMGHRAFMRTWAARHPARIAGPALVAEPLHGDSERRADEPRRYTN